MANTSLAPDKRALEDELLAEPTINYTDAPEERCAGLRETARMVMARPRSAPHLLTESVATQLNQLVDCTEHFRKER